MNKQVNGNLRLRRLQLRNLGLAFSLYQLLRGLLEALANNRPRPRIQEREIHIAASMCVFEHDGWWFPCPYCVRAQAVVALQKQHSKTLQELIDNPDFPCVDGHLRHSRNAKLNRCPSWPNPAPDPPPSCKGSSLRSDERHNSAPLTVAFSRHKGHSLFMHRSTPVAFSVGRTLNRCFRPDWRPGLNRKAMALQAP